MSNLSPKAKAKTKPQIKWSIASVALHDAYTDFILSRQAMNCAPATLQFYGNTAGVFLAWCEGQGITQPQEVTARIVRQYLAGLEGKADRTRHAHARAIKTLLRFWHAEKYIPEIIKFEMPKIAKKRLPRLTAEQLQAVLKVCNVRDKAGVGLAQGLNLRGVDAEILHPTAKSNQENWGALYMALKAGTIELPNDAKLRQQLLTLTIRTTQTGWKVEDVPSIHNDRTVAVAGACYMTAAGTVAHLPRQETQRSKWEPTRPGWARRY